MKTTQFIPTTKFILLLLLISLGFSSCNKKKVNQSTTENPLSKVETPKQDIHEAIIKGSYEVLEKHIKAETDINKKETMSGSTPLVTAITFNKPEMVKALLKANVNLSIKNNDGSTALHTAAFFGRIDMVKMLLTAGADKTVKNNFGATPRETVIGDFEQMKPIYKMLTQQLKPMGFALDLNELEKTRPVVAMMLQ